MMYMMKKQVKFSLLANEALTEKIYDLINAGVTTLQVLYIDNVNFSDQIRNTFFG